MKSLILFFGLMTLSAGLLFGQPKTIFGQNDKTRAKTEPPVVIRTIKPTRAKTKNKQRNSAYFHKNAGNKRKKPAVRRKIDLSKVPRVIKVTKPN